MGEPAYSYATHLNIKFDPLKLIDVSSLAKEVTDKWYNQTLCKVNDSLVRLGVMQGEYHWHKHDNDDEFFFVLRHRLVKTIGARAKLPFRVHAHMLRHACGYALANAGHDTRLIQDWLGHRAIQHTARYTELSPTRFKDVWR